MQLKKLFIATRGNFLPLLAGNVVSKLVLAFGGIFLAKYYGPERYGFYNVFVSYVLIVSMIASLRLENIIVLTDREDAARNLFRAILWVGMVFIPVFFVLLLFTGVPFFEKPEIPVYIYILCGLCCLFTLVSNAFAELFTRLGRFRVLATGTALSGFLTVLLQLVFLLTGVKDWGLPLGLALSVFITIVYFGIKDHSRFSFPDLQYVKKTVSAHPGIIRYTFLSDIINNIANNSIPILILGYFSQKEAGVFSMAMKAISIPMLILHQSASRVFFKKATALFHERPAALRAFVRRISYNSALLTLFFVIVMNTVGVYVLNRYFGASWNNIGVYILILSFWIVSRSAVIIISPVTMVIRKNHYSLLFNVYFLLITFLAFYLGALKESLPLAVSLFSFLSGAGYLVLLFFIMSVLKQYENV
ncbi:oligosaccharide flippase family protein [Niabella hirudinis]|uniref:oligosaccharide flippase family protein n=1 Tax=Niabella hirudinis TaxID=1285929 RepID=UPI003EBF0331